MRRQLLNITLAATAALFSAVPAVAQQVNNVNDIKSHITDSNIIFPESYEIDTQKMRERWYLKNYTATDERYVKQEDVATSDATIIKRLSDLNNVIEMPFNQIVREHIDRFTKKGRAQVATLLGLSIYYMPIFEQALEEEGLPLELKYLPVIESGLNPNAVSKHGAAGLWQFVVTTGKGLDMEVSSLVDERRDPYVSSKKAAGYLKDLYKYYGDWTLAIAAYNCGPGTVNKAMKRSGSESHDFWSLYYYLPAETRGYVPAFIAANYVMNYYPYHNISPVLATKPLVTDTLMISKRVHFDQISKVLDIPVEEIRVLNPQFRADVIPGCPDRPYTLVLPSQQIHAYIVSENAILAYDAEKYAQRTEVQPGEEPGETEARQIEKEAQEELRIREEAPLEQQAVAQQTPVKKTTKNNAATKTVSHKVEPDETLSGIAEKYKVTVDEIKEWNNLSRNTVRTGQMLRITTTPELADASGSREVAPANKNNSKSATDTAKTNNDKKNTKADKQEDRNSGKKNKKDAAKKSEPAAPKTHSVKSGENLTTIAKKYGTTAQEIMKANNMTSDKLQPGDNLKLPAKASQSGKGGKKSTSGSKGKSKKKKR